MSGRRVRAAAAAGAWSGTTRGAAPGHVQCNVAILPGTHAEDFARWCERNPAIAPVLARSAPGDHRLPGLGDLDVRTDLPAYRVFTDGTPTGTVPDLRDHWIDDLVAFAFGCSFSLEDALERAGVPLAYRDRGFGGAIYRTSVAVEPHAGFDGPVVVSMRPIAREAVAAAVAVSERFPQLHGAPIHVGDPAAIGVDLDDPLDAIGAVGVAAGEEPVFWACGVTTQEVIARAAPPRAFTHVSGQMLVCDLLLDDLAGVRA